jgi:Adenylosuccinate lyase (EC 4.3.2.2)
MAESVMIDLTRRGMNRQDAHERIRLASMQALAEGRPLAEVLGKDPEVIRFCSQAEIAALLSPDAYIGTAVEQVQAVIGKLRPLAS